ncbi:ubiquitin carboxyl-terminal hydrolase 36 isoform X2 [Athalia rosae]|uniref:ubiquitin carboxyl-terminal hydrolase 36 isoform X2 n=1 Tax=Athalia rosae TaxID=37344 RepID=UPI0020336A3A|nr:ubiquitin carboxyl-terminal hydrolase 36 isoform X2 [Athalia rosae]
MPAVSVCDPVAAAIRYSLESSQSNKSSEDLSAVIGGNATRILESEIEYKEVAGYQSTVLEQLKAKYIVLSLPQHQQHSDKAEQSGKFQDSSVYSTSKKSEDKKMGPSLPEPAVTLYPTNKISLGWKGTLPVGAGMYNVGNTCYLNSTLQALFHVPALVNWLLSDQHHTSKCEQNNGAGECLTCAMAKTLQFSHQKSSGAIKPFYIYNKLKLICRTMVPGQQEDAHEFLRYLLEGMERAFLSRHKATKLDSYSKETTPINQIFGGYIRTEVKCLQCRHISTTFQHFQDLLVDIRKASTLDEALSSYFSREQLDNNDYKCEACKRRVPATKQFSLERPPKVLCVQLKRFSVLGGKISRHIGFKQTVDMGPYLWREPGEPLRTLTYKLTSMVTHMGPSVNCGHYTAVAQVSSGQFYTFDDSCVRPTSLSNVLSTNAYIMIFEMESQSQTKLQHQQPVKINGLVTTKNLLSIPNGCTNKTPNPKPSTSGIITLNGAMTSSAKSKEPNEKEIIGPQLPLTKVIGPQLPSQKDTGFIGPQLPQKLQDKDKSHLRLVMHPKNGKASNGNSLVPYDGSSEEEDASSNADKNSALPNSNLVPKSTLTNTSNNGLQKSGSLAKENSFKSVTNFKDAQKSSKSTGNGVSNASSKLPSHNGSSQSNTKGHNGTSANNNGAVPFSLRCQNLKVDGNSKAETNGTEKWHNPIRVKTDHEERVPTKAAASSIKGWQVSKDTPSPTAAATPNGWSVTDNKEDISKSTHHAAAPPSAAALRNFSGTNRSDTVSHLLKMSHRGYGSSSVSNWNGGRAHLEREVDTERREDRKRHLDSDEEEMDRGRVKKVKGHREYKERSNPGYNPFQDYQTSKSWNRPGGYARRAYYNVSHSRPRHGSNYRPPHYRNHNHSRDHYQRR